MENQNLVNFTNPPVVEVSCHISFKSLKLYGPYMGLLWADWQEDFLFCRERNLAGRRLGEPGFSGENYDFFSEDESRTLSLSRDGLRYTWKQSKSEESYPRFPEIFGSFQEYVSDVDQFAEQAEIGRIEVTHMGLFYHNLIPHAPAGTTPGNISEVLPAFNSALASGLSLETPSALNLQMLYEFPEMGIEMFVGAMTKSKEANIHLRLHCRDVGIDEPKTLPVKWFHDARQKIVTGFCELTSKSAQEKLWGLEE